MTQPAAHLDAADVGQASVEEDHVRPSGFHKFDHRLAVARLTDHLDVAFRHEHRHQAFTDHLMVVNDQDPDSPVLFHAGAGSLARIASPLSSPLRTSKVPPRSST
jgi:hypothetical protein